jgi:predicted nucleic acid-binding protein
MTAAVFVDTNVFVYAADNRETAKQSLAERRYRLSWWESLIVGAAQAQNCPLLLSEDLQDGAVYGGVTVRNPFTLGVSEIAAEYALAPVAVRQHRSRGRPKRPSSLSLR